MSRQSTKPGMLNKMINKGLLLDTHIWLWFATADSALASAFRKLIAKAANEDKIFISAISVWEIAMLEVKGKIKLGMPATEWVRIALAPPEINLLPLSPEIAVESCHLPDNFHGDPADRIIVASARLENLMLMTKDQKIIDYGTKKYVSIAMP